ncbi:hypothetical protein PANDA_013263 [Ailuropoda melanoleuca]|uniref:Peflin n=1 Tax=Ailuropoda melanoleuca TaxID=9646 RepID=D2HNJ0_AILME|nr:hypothetical protein PANDA_013263 [Ailuropoda melanoleuca]
MASYPYGQVSVWRGRAIPGLRMDPTLISLNFTGVLGGEERTLEPKEDRELPEAAQELEDRPPEPLQAATTLDPPMVEGSMAVGYLPVAVMEGVLPLEGLMDRQLVEDPMDTPTLGDSPLELQEDSMVERPRGAPMVSHLRIPMVPSILGLMDRDLLQPHWMNPGSKVRAPLLYQTDLPMGGPPRPQEGSRSSFLLLSDSPSSEKMCLHTLSGPLPKLYSKVTQASGVPPSVDPEAYSWFQSVDSDHSGYISIKELKQALVNSNWSSFNDETCLMMINMFDKTKSGRIDVYGFSALWKFIQQWKNLFQQYDRDRSGSISYAELQQALSQMGYNLSPQFTQLLVSRYCPRSANPAMQLDRFIQVCTQLQVLTEAFREKDTAVQGNIRLSFEDFVTMTASRML